MKTIKIETVFVLLLLFFPGLSHAIHAIDIEMVNSPELLDRLLSFSGPAAPEIFNDMVIFTAASGPRRLGIAFADEGFSKVHWFRQLFARRDVPENPADETETNLYRDTGILFYIHQIPNGSREIEYRLIIDGLWTIDPLNPDIHKDSVSGLSWSVLSVPFEQTVPNPLDDYPGALRFSFRGPPGETVSVAGSFNGWDPFMYELTEGPAGNYSISIPLPPGRYQYIFFHKGQRFLDPLNSARAYSKDGNAVSEIVMQ